MLRLKGKLHLLAEMKLTILFPKKQNGGFILTKVKFHFTEQVEEICAPLPVGYIIPYNVTGQNGWLKLYTISESFVIGRSAFYHILIT